MKRLKLFFACLLMAVLSIGQVWAETATLAISSAVTANGNITDDASNTWAVSSDGSYTSNNSYIQCGTNSKAVSYIRLTTSAFSSKKITKVQVWGTSKANTNVSAKVIIGTTTVGTSNVYTSQTASSGGTEFSVNNTNEETGNLTIEISRATSANGAIYFNKAIVTYEDGGGSEPSLTLSPSSKSVEATDVENQSVTLTPANFASAISSVTPVLYNDEECTEAITSGAWVTNITVNGAKTAVTFDVADNDGAARNCWMKITASDGTGNASAVLAISQAKYEAPATLPFAYDGNGTGELPNGLSVSGTGTYSSSPAIKFDGTGDYILIHFSDTPGKLTYTIKGNSFNGGTFKVQESADGVNYTDVKSYSSLGDAQNEDYDLKSTSRYVKFIYTNKSSGNVALGNIAISKYVAPASVATPEISGDDNFYPTVEVSMSCETDGAAIYYTTDATKGAGDPSTDTWTPYDNENKPSFSETTTVYAAAKKGNDWSNKANKTFTKIVPLTTMAEVQAAVPSSGTVNINVTISNWVVTGVSSNQVWITDATNEKGILLFKSNHGFTVGNKLNGTVLGTGLTKYNGFAELNSLTSSQVAVTSAEAITPRTTTIAALTSGHPAEQGTIVKLENVTYNGTAFSDGTNTITIDTRFHNPTLESGHNYNLSGVVFYGSSNAIKIMPRSAADVVEIVPAGAPEFNPASKKFVGSISVELSQENSLPIYYTDDASKKDAPSITTWTEYTSAIPVTATKTIYAAAKDGDDWSDVVDATYTKAEPLTTMADVQAAATQTYDQLIDVTITNWVVTAVDNIGSADNKRVWIADADNMKGILLYAGNYAHGFTVGKKMNGTVFDTKIKAYLGFAELTSLKAADVDVTDAEAITARTTTIADLATGRPAEQGTIVKLENLAYDGTEFSDGVNTISIDTRLYEPTLTNGKRYDLTGVVFYSSATAIKLMPRSAADVEQLEDKTLSSISISGTYPTAFEIGDAFSHEGMIVTAHYTDESSAPVTASATFSGYDMSATGEQTVTVTYEENEVSKTAEYTITVNAPAPTGDFEELDGELVAGDYLIYEGGSLMLAEISSSRFAYAEQEPDANGVISNPSRYAVWTLAKSGDYWTFYNAKAEKYAAATGASGKAQLMDGNSDDKAKWAIDDDLVVTNKYNTENNVNATLRHNFSGTNNYGFACYNATQGGKPVFYKKADPSYYISATLTGCSAAEGNPTKVPQTLTEDVVLKYNLTAGYVWPDAITVTVGGVALDPAEVDYVWDTDKAPAELTIDYTKVNGNIAVSITAIEKELDNITIAHAPNKVAYETGEFFNPAGLQISLNYTAGASDVVEYSNLTAGDFTFSPDLETELAPENIVVEITYGGKSVNQAITVTNPVAVEKTVVVIAEYDSKLYAMSNAVASSACAAIEVTKDGDDLVVTSEANKAAVQWFMSKLGSNVKLQVANNEGQYLSAGSSAALSLVVDDELGWNYSEADGKYLISKDASRAIMYQSAGNAFKHYATSNVDGYAKVSEIFEVAEGAMNIKVVVPVVYEFTIDPDEAVAFGTVEQGDDVAAKSFDVTLTNIASATVTLSDDAAFSINTTALTENGTITVTPNTANVGNFAATITLHDEAGNAEDKVINVTMKVAAPKDCDRTDDFNTVDANNSYLDRESDEGWSAVYTAVVENDEVTYWMINGKTTNVGVITSPEFNYGIKELSFDYYYSYNETHGISFKVEIKQNGSVVKTETITKADAVKNTIYSATIEDIDLEGKYQIVFTNLCPSNSTSNADRYAIGNLCWKKYGEPVYETVRENLAADRYYTLCFNKKMTAVQGATFWSLVSKDGNLAYLVEEQAPYAAGKPYIIYAEAAGGLTAVLEGAATDEAGTNGALHGTFENMDQAALDAAGTNIYVLSNNSLVRVDGQSENSLKAYRAYIALDELGSGAPNAAPGRRVRAIPMGQNTVTGIDELNASETPVKMIIDGQLYILRGEKMYNANGQIVK